MDANLQPEGGPLFAAGVEALVILVIMAASAVFNWIQKRGQKGNEWEDIERRPTAPPTTHKPTVNWEEELRKMLDVPSPQPPPVAPPPVIPQHKPTPAPPPIPAPAQRPTMHVPPVFQQVKMYKGHCEECGGHIEFPSNLMGETIVCPHCYKHTALQPYGDTRVEQITHQTEIASLKESASAYERASHLDKAVAQRFQQLEQQPVAITSVENYKKRSAEIDSVVAMLRNPKTARQAVIASVVLNPPKALEA